VEAGKRGRNRYTNKTFRRGLASADSRSRIFKVIENVQSRLVKLTTRFSQCNGARGPVNQFGAELSFEGGDLLLLTAG
jgi:hypothetical protein